MKGKKGCTHFSRFLFLPGGILKICSEHFQKFMRSLKLLWIERFMSTEEVIDNTIIFILTLMRSGIDSLVFYRRNELSKAFRSSLSEHLVFQNFFFFRNFFLKINNMKRLNTNIRKLKSSFFIFLKVFTAVKPKIKKIFFFSDSFFFFKYNTCIIVWNQHLLILMLRTQISVFYFVYFIVFSLYVTKKKFFLKFTHSNMHIYSL